MCRKLLTVLAVIAAIALAVAPTDAGARGKGGRGAGWHGDGEWHGGVGYRRGRGWGVFGVPYSYSFDPYSNGYGAFYSPNNCRRTVCVMMPRGVTWRRIWVCG